MRLENSFEVPAPPDQAWALLLDVPRVIPCMPGAELTETVDENTFKATMHVKLGPVSLQFATDISREVDEAARRTVMHTKAREMKGRGGANATIESTLEPAGQGTKVMLVTEMTLSGTVAQYGRGIVADVSNQLVKRFADCIAQQLAAPAPTNGAGDLSPAAPKPAQEVKPVGGLGLAFAALGRSLLRLFGRK